MQQIEQQKSSTSAGSDAQISSLERKVRALEASLLHQVMLLLFQIVCFTASRMEVRMLSACAPQYLTICTNIALHLLLC
jgi:hypothetical protein